MENFRLKVFRTVASYLNFRRAAEELLLTQPAVTQQIKSLEEECGLPLFDRSGGRIRLTAAGETLLPYAERLNLLAEEAIAALGQLSESGRGSLALGASQTIGQYLLPNFVAAFLLEHPHIQITATSGNTEQMLEELASQRIQMALVEGPSRRKDIHLEPFMEDQMVLVVPASHEWASMQIRLEQLAEAPLLMRELGSGSRRVVEQALRVAGVAQKKLKIRMELDSTEGLLNAVEAGLGVTFVSRWAVRNQLALGTLRLARVSGLNIERMFSVAYPVGPEPVGNAQKFLRFLRARRAEMRTQPPRAKGEANNKSTPRRKVISVKATKKEQG